jgi:hypothetical protein
MSKDMQKTQGSDPEMHFSVGGVFDEVDQLARAILALGKAHNLVVPGGAIGRDLPMLYSAGISFIFPDIEHDTYKIRGSSKLGIGKVALDRIARGAGVRWNPMLCGRVDDNSNSNFIEYQVAGAVLQLDGTEGTISAIKRIDLRADKATDVSTWGADSQEIAKDAANAKDGAGNPAPRDPWPQILQARQHILSNAETKAKNRAVRSLGIRASYTPDEIRKGFAVVRLQFTGHHEDPEIEREVAMKIADRALGSSSMLYGRPGPERLERPSPRAMRAIARLATVVDDEDEPADRKETRPDPTTETKPAAETPKTATTETPATDKAAEKTAPEQAPAPPKDDPLLICGDRLADNTWPKKPASQFTSEDLRRKISSYEKKQPDWDPRWAEKNQAELNAMKSWLAFKELDPRQGTLPGTPKAAADGDIAPY